MTEHSSHDSIRHRDHLDRTPLHYAAATDGAGLVDKLIKAGAEIDARDHWQHTPLHLAAQNDNPRAVAALLLHNADVNARSATGETPLIMACKNKNAGIASLLTRFKADVDAQENSRGFTALHYACLQNSAACVRLLLRHQAKTSIGTKPDGETPYHIAARESSVDALRALMQAPDCSAAELPLSDANKSSTPLHLAALFGNIKALDILLEAGVNPDPVDQQGHTPLDLAIKEGRAETMQHLIRHGCDFGKPHGVDARSSLHHAAFMGRPVEAYILVCAGADMTQKDSFGMTPMDLASAWGHFPIVEEFIRAGHPPTPPDGEPAWTALHSAASRGKGSAAQRLLELGMDPNWPAPGSHDTPLHVAAQHNARLVAAWLIEGGADLFARNNVGRTAADIARIKHHDWLLELLEENMKTAGQNPRPKLAVPRR